MGQKWIHNQDLTVEQAVSEFANEVKQKLSIKSFVKYKVGEGIEIKKSDFNEEVKSLAGA
jgi:elongation factor Ts